MQFPVYIGWGAWKIHPHLFFEAIAYFTAMRLALGNFRRDVIPATQRSLILVGGLLGALIGAKTLVVLQHWQELMQAAGPTLWLLLLQGKTVVGALLGGLAGVEVTKAILKIKTSTGDAFVYPLLVGTVIGRLGCFFTGVSDRTYGTVTDLPWGIDFGDGLLRHPTQLYEIAFLLALGLFLRWRSRFPLLCGDLYKMYMIAYLTFRLTIDAIKPDPHPLLGLSAIQIACLLGLAYYAPRLPSVLPPEQPSP
jgi:phosphatidylglycerol---prolipoprotein diacylglyceryl transferase